MRAGAAVCDSLRNIGEQHCFLQRGECELLMAMTRHGSQLDHLDRSGRLAAWPALQPRAAVNAVVACAILLSWATLALLAVGTAQRVLPAEAAPGDRLLRLLPELPLPDWAAYAVSLCVGPASLASGVATLALLWAMWILMSAAMMLPSAAPMIRTYCEIADTAAAKGEAVVHPTVLVAGYLSVWVLAALPLAGLSTALAGAAGPASGVAAAAVLGLAGLYQFSGLKEACLRKCRNPFAVLFSRWSDRPGRVFRLGMEQGLWCLGCCWALMLVMLAVGVMNVFWMALVGLFTIVEKQWDSRLPSRLAGAILLVWAAALLVVSL